MITFLPFVIHGLYLCSSSFHAYFNEDISTLSLLISCLEVFAIVQHRFPLFHTRFLALQNSASSFLLDLIQYASLYFVYQLVVSFVREFLPANGNTVTNETSILFTSEITDEFLVPTIAPPRLSLISVSTAEDLGAPYTPTTKPPSSIGRDAFTVPLHLQAPHLQSYQSTTPVPTLAFTNPSFMSRTSTTTTSTTLVSALPSFHVPPFHFPSPMPFPPSAQAFTFKTLQKTKSFKSCVNENCSVLGDPFQFEKARIQIPSVCKIASPRRSPISKLAVSPSPRRQRRKYIPPFKRQSSNYGSVADSTKALTLQELNFKDGGKAPGAVRFTAAPPISKDGTLPVGFKRRRLKAM